MRTIYLSSGINIVQNARINARQKRSARTGLALALLTLTSQASAGLLAALWQPAPALAQSNWQASPQTISSASPSSNTDFTSQTPPKTRISRPHAAKTDDRSAPAGPRGTGDGIKLLPLQPVTDPITPSGTESAPAGKVPAPGAGATNPAGGPARTGQPGGRFAGQPPYPPGFQPPAGSPAGFGYPNGYPQGYPPANPPASKTLNPLQFQAAGAPPAAAPALPGKPAQLGPGGEDPYPTIGRLETVTLGIAQPSAPITDRLAKLETTVFKRVYNDDSLFDRTDRLKKTLLGPDVVDPNSAAGRDRDDLSPLSSPTGLGFAPGGGMAPGLGLLDPNLAGLELPSAIHYLDEIASRPENREAATPEVLSQFALEIINNERRNAGLGLLGPDQTAESVAGTHVQELAKRSVLSHFSLKGENPDRRYTQAGGKDALVESIASVKCSELGNKKLSKAALARTIKSLLTRQDDRDALMAPDATNLGFAMALSCDNDKVLSTFEVVTRHGLIEGVQPEVALGEKLEIKGAIEAPYIFDRITVAWEASNGAGNASAADESEDALPYFPPLDYIAYANRADHDYSKAIFALKAAGVVAAIAGGMFIPPVALAAPLIMMSGNPGGEPKPVSDIPVKGGVKVDGAAFDAKIPISNANKEGLYYITIYGSLGSHAQQSVAISRRVVLARVASKDEVEKESKPAEKIDEEVSAHADLPGKTGTTGSGDLAPAPVKAPIVFTPETKDEGKTDAAPKP